MRRMLTMVGMGVAFAIFGLWACSQNPAIAQAGRPPPGEGPNCSPVHELKADAAVNRIMQDNDGDWWVTIRFTSTGRVLIGFLSRATGKFCVTGEGRQNPES